MDSQDLGAPHVGRNVVSDEFDEPDPRTRRGTYSYGNSLQLDRLIRLSRIQCLEQCSFDVRWFGRVELLAHSRTVARDRSRHVVNTAGQE